MSDKTTDHAAEPLPSWLDPLSEEEIEPISDDALRRTSLEAINDPRPRLTPDEARARLSKKWDAQG